MNFADSIKTKTEKETIDVVADINGESYEEWEERMKNTKKELSCDEILDAVSTSIYEEFGDSVFVDIMAISITKKVANKLFDDVAPRKVTKKSVEVTNED